MEKKSSNNALDDWFDEHLSNEKIEQKTLAEGIRKLCQNPKLKNNNSLDNLISMAHSSGKVTIKSRTPLLSICSASQLDESDMTSSAKSSVLSSARSRRSQTANRRTERGLSLDAADLGDYSPVSFIMMAMKDPKQLTA